MSVQPASSPSLARQTGSANLSDRLAGAWPLFLVGIAVLLGVLFMLTRDPPLDRSILGFEGFTLAARKEGVSIVNHSGGPDLNAGDYGLRILPLYDRDLRFTARSIADNDLNSALREIRQDIVLQKIRAVATLLVLPKWTRGAMRQEVLHEKFLITPKAISLMGRSVSLFRSPGLEQGPPEFTTAQTKLTFQPWLARASRLEIQDLDVGLYAPQTLSSTAPGASREAAQTCRTLVRWKRNTLVAQCRYTRPDGGQHGNFWDSQNTFFLLTDPDVLNNHGAGNAQNFEFGLALVKALAADNPIVMDLSVTPDLPTVANRDRGGRRFSDLVQFFQPPFTLFWLAFAILTIATLWRASLRLNPIRDREDVTGLGASRQSMVEAEAAIFRAGGSARHDQKLATLYVANRISAVERDLLGALPQIAQEPGASLLRALDRRNPGLANRLRELRQAEISDRPPHIIVHLKTLEQTLNEIRHEFGKPASAR